MYFVSGVWVRVVGIVVFLLGCACRVGCVCCVFCVCCYFTWVENVVGVLVELCSKCVLCMLYVA